VRRRPLALATGNEATNRPAFGGTALTTYGSAGEMGVVQGGEEGWWGWEADIPLAPAEGWARVCSSEHSNEPLGRAVLLPKVGTGFQRVLHPPRALSTARAVGAGPPSAFPVGKAANSHLRNLREICQAHKQVAHDLLPPWEMV
jgi:hypothetical protein